MGVLTFTATTGFSDTDASISAIGTAADIAIKLRIEVDVLRDMAAWEQIALVEVGNLAGTDRCSLGCARDASDGFTLYWNNTSTDAQITFNLTDLPAAGQFIVWYGHVGATDGCEQWLEDSGGSAIGTPAQAGWSTAIGASGSGNGFVRVGAGVDNALTTTGPDSGDFDGVAVYTTNKADADRHSNPDSDSTNRVHYCPWKENSGSTAADEDSASDHTISSGTLAAGGSWNGSGGGGGAGLMMANNMMHAAR